MTEMLVQDNMHT